MEEPVFLTHRLIIARHFYLLDTRRFCARKKSSPMSASCFSGLVKISIGAEEQKFLLRDACLFAMEKKQPDLQGDLILGIDKNQNCRLRQKCRRQTITTISILRIFHTYIFANNIACCFKSITLRRFLHLCCVPCPFSCLPHDNNPF